MTPTTQKLRSLINKACPDLLELRFGCEVATLDGVRTVLWVTGRPEGSVMALDVCRQFLGFKWNDEITILGTPPTLEHLLRALHQKEHYLTPSMDNILKITIGTVNVMYNLTKSPLEQSQEVQEALVALLE